jgi:flagellar motility protein MotE (MotC chaperone)
MVRILQSRGFAALAGVVLYVGITAWFWPRFDASHRAGSAAEASYLPSWEFHNLELEQLVADLKQEKAALAERKSQLDELAARLQAEQLELNAVTQSVHQLQRELDQTLVRVAEEETANLKKLARVYSAMSPEGAAGIMKQLEEATIVKIMAFMKETETAPILETLAALGDQESKLAATICERLRLTVARKTDPVPRT